MQVSAKKGRKKEENRKADSCFCPLQHCGFLHQFGEEQEQQVTAVLTKTDTGSWQCKHNPKKFL